jgi:hypothetical protein
VEQSSNCSRGPPRALDEQYYTKTSKNNKIEDVNVQACNNIVITSNKDMNYCNPSPKNISSFPEDLIADANTAVNRTPGVDIRSKGCYSRHHSASHKQLTQRRYSQQIEDPTKYKTPREQNNQVIKTTVQNLDLECVCPRRAGVIIYTVVGESTYFGVGLDSRTHDLTDFGGGVCYKTDHNVIKGALREFDEETLSIFEPITLEKIKHCPTIYDNNNLIVFIHMQIDPDTVSQRFNEKYTRVIEMRKCGSHRRHRDPEVCGITWLTWEEFRYCIKENGIMFSRVQKFLAKADDFSYLL